MPVFVTEKTLERGSPRYLAEPAALPFLYQNAWHAYTELDATLAHFFSLGEKRRASLISAG